MVVTSYSEFPCTIRSDSELYLFCLPLCRVLVGSGLEVLVLGFYSWVLDIESKGEGRKGKEDKGIIFFAQSFFLVLQREDRSREE